MKRWSWLWLLLLVLVCFSAQAKEKTLQYVVHGVGDQFDAYKKLIEGFTKETGIPVDIIPVSSQKEKWEKIFTLVAGGVSPDVVGGVSTEFGEHAASGLLRPLDDLIKRDKVNLGQIVPVFLEALKYQGKQYLIPYGSSALPMFYNRDHLDTAGLPYPPKQWNTKDWTYNRFVEYARKLTKRNADGNIIQWGVSGQYWDSWLSLPYTWGGDWITEDLTKFQGDKPEAIAALQSLQDLIHKEQVMKNAYNGASFQDGTSAMAGMGTWYIKGLLNTSTNWDFMPWFRVNETTQAAVFPIGYGILSSSTNQENAWKLIQYLTWNANVNLSYALTAGALPALRANLPQWAKQMKQLANVSPEVAIDQVGNYGAIVRIRKVPTFTSINAIMVQACQEVTAQNKKSAAAAMTEVADRINALLK